MREWKGEGKGGSRTEVGGDAGREGKEADRAGGPFCPLAGHGCHCKSIARVPERLSETWLKEASICAVSGIQRRANGPSEINMQACTL